MLDIFLNITYTIPVYDSEFFKFFFEYLFYLISSDWLKNIFAHFCFICSE